MSDRYMVCKVGPDGRVLTSYPGQPLEVTAERLALRCRWRQPEPLAVGPLVLEEGDLFIEHFYPGRWFNVFTVYSAADALKGWYCNVTYPVELGHREVCWRDLALDLVVGCDGERQVLDRDEFESLAPPPDVRRQAEAALATLLRWVDAARPPFEALADPGGHG